VLCRLLGVRDDPQRADVEQQLWKAAAALLPVKRVGAFNQALMELGALVCTPVTPRCQRCPLAQQCTARSAGMQDTIPMRAKRARIVQADEVAVVVMRDNRVLLVRRSDDGRWAGMWEFPHLEQEPLVSFEGAAKRLLAGLGFRGKLQGGVAYILTVVTRC